MMFATYDYWGYYNITFLGGEVKDAARTVPRAILISIALVAAIYLAMNISVLAVLPWQGLVGAQNGERSIESRRAQGGDLHVYGDGVRAAGGAGAGQSSGGTGDDDGVLRRVLAAAGLLAHTLCGGARWQLLPRIRQAASQGLSRMFRC